MRTGRGVLDRNKKDIGLWTYAIKSRDRIATGHMHFKLEQTGIVVGADQLNELMHGKLYVGGFGSYDQGRVAHARGVTVISTLIALELTQRILIVADGI